MSFQQLESQKIARAKNYRRKLQDGRIRYSITVYSDQAEVIDDAFVKAMKERGTKNPALALESVALSYLTSGFAIEIPPHSELVGEHANAGNQTATEPPEPNYLADSGVDVVGEIVSIESLPGRTKLGLQMHRMPKRFVNFKIQPEVALGDYVRLRVVRRVFGGGKEAYWSKSVIESWSP